MKQTMNLFVGDPRRQPGTWPQVAEEFPGAWKVFARAVVMGAARPCAVGQRHASRPPGC
jgi:hypothetical protein